MNRARILQLLTATAVIAVGSILAMMIENDARAVAILVATGVFLLFVMWGREPAEDPVRPPVHAVTDPDLLAMTGFRRIIDGLSDPLLIIQRGKVAFANPSALSLLGRHIIGEDVRIAIRHPAAAERLTSPDMPVDPVTIDIVGIGARNQRWAMSIIPVDSVNGQPRLLVHLSDRSGAYAAERVRGDFVANASHELRTPLAAILGFIETLQDPNAGGDAQTRARFLSILEKEARRMQQLVDDLMSLSRIEADKYRMPTTQIDMPALIDEVLILCRQNLGARGADIVSEVGDAIPPVQGDRTQVGQLLHNLVSNSAKYGRAGTPIVVQLAPAPPSMIRLQRASGRAPSKP